MLFNISFLVFINFLIKPFWIFGIDRTIQNQLGEAEYGLFFAVLNFTYIFQILLDFGLQNYNVRHIASDEKKITELLPNIILFKLLLFLIYLIVCVSIAAALGYTHHPFFFIIVINQFLLSFIIYLRSNISAHQHFITDSFLSVLDKLLMIGFCTTLVWGNTGIDLSIYSFVFAQLLAYLITFLITLYFSFSFLRNSKVFISFELIKKIIKESMPYAVIYFLMTIYYRIDGVMLEQMRNSYEVGIYAQGYRIIESVNNIGYLMSIVLLPIFSHYLAKKKDIKIVLIPAIRIICIAIISIVGLGYFQSKEIIGIMYHSDTLYAAEVFSWLILNFIPIGLLYVISTLLTANENFKVMIPVLIIAVFLNISLNFFLIKSKGAVGAAQTTLITQIFILLVYTSFCIYKFRLRPDIFSVLKVISVVGLSLILMQFLLYQFNNQSFGNLLYRSILYLTGVGVLSLLFNIINKDILKIKIGTE